MAFWDKFKFKKSPFRRPSAEPAASPAAAAPTKEIGAPAREFTGDAFRVLVKPLVTEKTARLAARGQYGFVVARSANKTVVADAVEAVYGIRPVSVNICRMRGKEVRFGQKVGRRKDWKKAIVTLPEGKKISIYEGV